MALRLFVGWQQLSLHPSISNVGRLKRNSFGDVGAKALATVLKTNTTLTTLKCANLCRALRVTMDDMTADRRHFWLLEQETTHTYTHTHNLTPCRSVASNSIGPAGISSLANALKTNSTLICLRSEVCCALSLSQFVCLSLSLSLSLSECNAPAWGG
jgi:hypothetical protein